jgi:hypothetical protein
MQKMMDLVCRPYGWFNLQVIGLHHLPVIWRLLPKDNDDNDDSRWSPFCSMAYSRAARNGGLDPVPGKADRETAPDDLAMSPLLEYQFTLSADANDANTRSYWQARPWWDRHKGKLITTAVSFVTMFVGYLWPAIAAECAKWAWRLMFGG